jgi:hypothetical protein
MGNTVKEAYEGFCEKCNINASFAKQWHLQAPAQEAISYETASTWPGNHGGHHGSYSGPPSTENNNAWDAVTRRNSPPSLTLVMRPTC